MNGRTETHCLGPAPAGFFILLILNFHDSTCVINENNSYHMLFVFIQSYQRAGCYHLLQPCSNASTASFRLLWWFWHTCTCWRSFWSIMLCNRKNIQHFTLPWWKKRNIPPARPFLTWQHTRNRSPEHNQQQHNHTFKIFHWHFLRDVQLAARSGI